MDSTSDSSTSRSWASHAGKDLKQKSVRGATATLSSQGLIFVITLGYTSILSRLLTPADFGLVAMAMPVVLFMTLFQDLGLSAAAIQRAELTETHVNQLFWVNVWAGLILSLVTVAGSPLVAAFYHQPRLTYITMALGSTFFISGLAAQQRALLQRSMNLGFLSMARLVAALIGAVCGIVSALFGAGYWSLVILNLAQTVLTSLFVWGRPQFRPHLSFGLRGTKEFLTFGLNYTGFYVLNFVSRNIDNILIGRFWGSVELGFYSRAYTLLLLPLRNIVSPFANVVIPGLSRLQDDPKRYATYYLKALSMLCSIALPVVVAMIVLSHDIVEVFLGARWLPAVRIFSILGVVALLNTTYTSVSWIYVSLGRTRRQLSWGIVSTAVSVAGIVGGLQYKGFGVAVGYTAANVVLFLPAIWYATKGTPLSMAAVLKANVRPLVVAAGVGVAVYLVSLAHVSHRAYLRLLVEVAVAAVLWTVLSLAVSRADSPAYQLAKMLRRSKSSRETTLTPS